MELLRSLSVSAKIVMHVWHLLLYATTFPRGHGVFIDSCSLIFFFDVGFFIFVQLLLCSTLEDTEKFGAPSLFFSPFFLVISDASIMSAVFLSNGLSKRPFPNL